MKNYYITLLLFVFVTFVNAQNKFINHGGGEYAFPKNTADCISESQRASIFKEIQDNRVLLEQRHILNNAQQRLVPHPLFIWPVIKNPTAPYNNVWSISNHVDHNPNYPNQTQDFACGTRTYDTSGGYNHAGIDIFTWPFTWYMFQNSQAWAIAAAPGVIVGKSDGNFDMSCAFNSNTWNAVYVQHADGSVAWYGHLKNGSLTTKTVGDAVAVGEYIGTVGSSGNSTGPHLHFEVHNASNQLVDTYTGACNTWASSSDSWWQVQKPYQDPKINAVLTHSQLYSFNTCPQTETTYFSDAFAPGSSVIISIYLADQLPSTSCQIQMVRPDSSIADSFNFNFTTFYVASYWYWTYTSGTFNQTGTWKVRLTYQGNTVEHEFYYGALGNTDFKSTKFQLYPNPANHFVSIENKEHLKIYNIELYDSTGKKLQKIENTATKIDISGLAKGVYFIAISSEDGIYKNKIIKD